MLQAHRWCRECGDTLPADNRRSFCSTKCRYDYSSATKIDKYKINKPPKPCPVCGTMHKLYLYCSDACAISVRRKAWREKSKRSYANKKREPIEGRNAKGQFVPRKSVAEMRRVEVSK